MSDEAKLKSVKSSASSNEIETDVLYQRIFNKWYAFSVIEDECLVSEVSEEEVHRRRLARKPAA